ncbi:hypothetical protein [Rhodococcus tukisamuensis]|nr:hypothetical protein [Rhodococcus tukisamuensis]
MQKRQVSVAGRVARDAPGSVGDQSAVARRAGVASALVLGGVRR